MAPLLEFGLIALGLYVAGWISKKAGMSSILGYISLGLLLGPGGPVTVFEITPVTSLLGELGLVLLLFYMGLEFSLGRFLEGKREISIAGSIDLLNFVVGAGVGMAFGFGILASVFLGSITYISSSGVIAKLLSERDLIAYPETERTLGVLVYEDLAMVVVLGGLGLATSGGRLIDFAGVAVFLVLYVLILKFGRAALERLWGREGEALVLIALGLVTLFSMGAKSLGFPEAVAAFLFGMLAAESQFKHRLESTLDPWYNVAAAAFFLDFGLHTEIATALTQLPAALLLAGLTIVVNLSSGYLSGRLTGLTQRASIGHGLMLLPRGEFSLVIAGLAASTALIPVATREALTGMTSLYVIMMVVVGSVTFRFYDQINDALLERLKSPKQREADRKRKDELDAMTLE